MQRLTSRAQFQAVLAAGHLARTRHFALHALALNSPQPDPIFARLGTCAGAMVPKRWAKRAVTRNAIKRQIYHVSTQFEPSLPVGAYLVRLRASFDPVQFVSATSPALKAAVRLELGQLFAGAGFTLPEAGAQAAMAGGA